MNEFSGQAEPAGRRFCMNGREIGAGKVPPCPNYVRHVVLLTVDGRPDSELHLCETCFQIARGQGLIEEPNIGKEEFERRKAEGGRPPS